MHASQTLKDEQTSLIGLVTNRNNDFQERSNKVYTQLSNIYQFLNKRLAINFKRSFANKLNRLTSNHENTNIIRIEIGSEKMNELLARHQICAADIRCLDTSSKQSLKKLCLKTCLNNTANSNPTPQLVDNLTIADSPLQLEKR